MIVSDPRPDEVLNGIFCLRLTTTGVRQCRGIARRCPSFAVNGAAGFDIVVELNVIRRRRPGSDVGEGRDQTGDVARVIGSDVPVVRQVGSDKGVGAEAATSVIVSGRLCLLSRVSLSFPFDGVKHDDGPVTAAKGTKVPYACQRKARRPNRPDKNHAQAADGSAMMY